MCESQNLAQVTPPENSPVGEEILTVEPFLVSLRYDTHVVLTDAGWLLDTERPSLIEHGFPRQATCD